MRGHGGKRREEQQFGLAGAGAHGLLGNAGRLRRAHGQSAAQPPDPEIFGHKAILGGVFCGWLRVPQAKSSPSNQRLVMITASLPDLTLSSNGPEFLFRRHALDIRPRDG